MRARKQPDPTWPTEADVLDEIGRTIGDAWPVPSLVVNAIFDGVSAAMPSTDQVLDAITEGVRLAFVDAARAVARTAAKPPTRPNPKRTG